MAFYRYKAVSADGEVLHGEMEGADEANVIARIQEAGHIPIRAEPRRVQGLRSPAPRSKRTPRASRREVALFTQELAVLLRAGLPLDRSLQIMAEVSDDGRLRGLTEQVRDAVRGGSGLSVALEAQAGIFSPFYVSLIRAAEAAGEMEAGLARLVEHQDRTKALHEAVVSALLYPAILVVASALSLMIILAYVVPQFTALFNDAGRSLPAPTLAVIGVAELLRAYGGLLLLAVAALALLARWQLTRPGARRRWDRRLLRLPLIGDLVRKMDMARLCRGLGTLLHNGVPIMTALSIARESLANSVLAQAVDVAGERVKSGGSLADELLSAGLFPSLGLQMIRVGEETGQLDEMLMRLADVYDREVRTAVQRMLTVLEPALIIGLGLAIAGIIISILVGILSVNELPL